MIHFPRVGNGRGNRTGRISVAHYSYHGKFRTPTQTYGLVQPSFKRAAVRLSQAATMI